MASKLWPQQADGLFYQGETEIGENLHFFYKTLRTRKFSRGKFFEGSTHGILMHSRFRICVLKGSATHFWPCYSCPKSGEGGKTRFASKNKEALKKITRLPENSKCQILVREVSKLHFESSLARIWHKKFSGGRVIFFYASLFLLANRVLPPSPDFGQE